MLFEKDYYNVKIIIVPAEKQRSASWASHSCTLYLWGALIALID